MRNRNDLTFSMSEYCARLESARASMDERGFQLLMVFAPENMYYLIGYNTIGYYTYQCRP